MTLREAKAQAARRGEGWTIRRDARRRGGWYIRSPRPKISRAAWQQMVRTWRSRCALCRRRTRLVREHNHRTGRIRFPTCSHCNCALGLLGRAGIKNVQGAAAMGGRSGHRADRVVVPHPSGNGGQPP